MQPRIENLPELKLLGQRITMSLADNRTNQLWRQFMPRRKEILHSISPAFYSVSIYPPLYFARFNPQTEFEKWAAMLVSSHDSIPAGFESLTIPSGMYAVFRYKGPDSAAGHTFRYIFESWLPGSAFRLDNRPHMEIMGERYKQEAADSEEDFWIPVLPQQTP